MTDLLHKTSTAVWISALLVATGFHVGYWFGVQHGPSAQDAKKIEYRLREVFCEQAIKNSLIHTCEVN